MQNLGKTIIVVDDLGKSLTFNIKLVEKYFNNKTIIWRSNVAIHPRLN